MCLCAIATMIFIEGIALLRLLFGPLSELWCWWLLFFNQSVPIISLLVFDAYYISRVCNYVFRTCMFHSTSNTFQYYYVVVFKTATICNEDFISFYLITLTVILGFLLSLVHNMSPGKWGLNYYICLGKNPELYNIQGGKFPVTVFVALFTIIVYAITSHKLYKARKTSDRILGLAEPLIQPAKKLDPDKKKEDVFWAGVFPHVAKFFYSTVDLITSYMIVIIIVMDTVLWNGYMKKLSVDEMKSTSSGHFYYIYHQHLYPLLFLWSIAISSFLRNAELRKRKLWNFIFKMDTLKIFSLFFFFVSDIFQALCPCSLKRR